MMDIDCVFCLYSETKLTLVDHVCLLGFSLLYRTKTTAPLVLIRSLWWTA